MTRWDEEVVAKMLCLPADIGDFALLRPPAVEALRGPQKPSPHSGAQVASCSSGRLAARLGMLDRNQGIGVVKSVPCSLLESGCWGYWEVRMPSDVATT